MDNFERSLPPHSVEMERCLLAAMMMDPDVLPQARSAVRREAFYQADHQVIFDALTELADAGKAIDAVTIREQLLHRGKLEEIGGTAYIGELLSTIPPGVTTAHWESWSDGVMDAWKKRAIISIATRAIQAAYGPDTTGKELISRLALSVAQVASKSDSGGYITAKDAGNQTLQLLESGGAPRIHSGLDCIDRYTGGFALGEMVVIAGRPSMGKSLVARQISFNMATQGISVGIISLEESYIKITKNMFSSWGAVNNRRMREIKTEIPLTPDEWSRIVQANERMRELPLYIDTKSSDIHAVCSRISEWVSRRNVQAVMIDHIGRISASGKDLYQRTSEVSQRLAEMVHRLNLVGLCLAQLNRGVTTREDKRPTLSDLRDSGKIEEDADAVLLIHREDYYHAESETQYQPTDIIEINGAKFRDGERNWVGKAHAELMYQRVTDIEEYP